MNPHYLESLQEIYKLIEQLEGEMTESDFDHRIMFLKSFVKGLIEFSHAHVTSQAGT